MRGLSFILSVSLLGCSSVPQWQKTESNTKKDLNALFGFGPNDVWAAGEDGTVLHFDGTTWSSVSSGTSRTFNSIWGAAPDDVWFVGRSGAVVRWNGATMSPVTGASSVDFHSVRGVGPKEIYLCSSLGLFLFDGSFHEFTRQGTKVNCRSLFSLDGTAVVALVNKSGSSTIGQVYTLNTNGSTPLEALGEVSNYDDANPVGVAPTDLWVLWDNAKSVMRLGSGTPRELVLPQDMSARVGWVRGPNDVWLGGSHGMLAHFDGAELKLKVAGDYNAPLIRALWGTTGVTWAAGTSGWLLRLQE